VPFAAPHNVCAPSAGNARYGCAQRRCTPRATLSIALDFPCHAGGKTTSLVRTGFMSGDIERWSPQGSNATAAADIECVMNACHPDIQHSLLRRCSNAVQQPNLGGGGRATAYHAVLTSPRAGSCWGTRTGRCGTRSGSKHFACQFSALKQHEQ
jgi:hypothetical protein